MELHKPIAMFNNKVKLSAAQVDLRESAELFKTYFTHGTLAVELYQPHQEDLQQPHTRDEVYIIADGRAEFELEGDVTPVDAGDFLFVPAGADHRFLNFSDNFSTWVLFYGPEGGEQGTVENGLPEE
jgi:mannose-6-phosphate isomerase-like protein (cupin superfamily)